jgi:alanine-synthesizing transaminase
LGASDSGALGKPRARPPRRPVEFRRLGLLPSEVPLAGAGDQAALDGSRLIDLGIGDPDLPPPRAAIEMLSQSVHERGVHGYAESCGLPELRSALADFYHRCWSVRLDPETEVTLTLGAKEGFGHLMWILLDRGDVAIVPEPSYPVHIYAPRLAGATTLRYRPELGVACLGEIEQLIRLTLPRPRVIVVSFPHNPTSSVVDLAFMHALVDMAREHEIIVVHDFPYGNLGFAGYEPPSILQVPGAADVAVEFYSLSKSFSMAGWRFGFMVGNSEIVQSLLVLKPFLDSGSFHALQRAVTHALHHGDATVEEARRNYESRCMLLYESLREVGWEANEPRAGLYIWMKIPPTFRHLSSHEFARVLVREAGVLVSPGSAFGPHGEGYVRFALVAGRDDIEEAARRIRRFVASEVEAVS